MFTGIVQELVTIQKLELVNGVVRVTLSLPKWSLGKSLTIGESVLLHGICTTVIQADQQKFVVELMPETVVRTNAGSWQVGQQLHAEPSLTLQTLMSGSLVYGHIDGTTQVISVDVFPGETVLRLAMPQWMQGYVISKGGVTINGANLTVVDVKPDSFTVHLIPQTQQLTTLGELNLNDVVNIELDYFTKTIKHVVQDLQGGLEIGPQLGLPR